MVMVKKEKRKERGVFVTKASNGYGLTFLVDNLRYSITKAFIVAFVLTFFSMLDVPVFWPILLCYWGVLFVLTMKRQILHMIKYKYVPFTVGKQVSYIGH